MHITMCSGGSLCIAQKSCYGSLLMLNNNTCTSVLYKLYVLYNLIYSHSVQRCKTHIEVTFPYVLFLYVPDAHVLLQEYRSVSILCTKSNENIPIPYQTEALFMICRTIQFMRHIGWSMQVRKVYREFILDCIAKTKQGLQYCNFFTNILKKGVLYCHSLIIYYDFSFTILYRSMLYVL